MRCHTLIILGLCLAAAPAHAQLAATVPSADPVYDLMTELGDVLHTPRFITGQRPLSRREIARILLAMSAEVARRTAETTRDDSPSVRMRQVLSALLAAYADDMRELRGVAPTAPPGAMPIEALQIEALGTNSSARRVPTNGLGGLDAYSNPLTDGRWGRPVANDGTTLSIETSVRTGIGDHVAFGAQPRVSLLTDSTRTTSANAGFQRLYARGVWHNGALEVGADEYLWGLGGTRGMLLSANPQPLHAITLSTDTAITLPWLLRAVGPLRAAFLTADLGQDRNFPGAKLFGYQVSSAPTGSLEVGAGLLLQIGGQGAPHASLLSEVGTLFPFLFWAVAPGKDTIQAAHLAQAEARWRVSESRGLSLYYELDLTDFELKRLKSVYTANGTHLVGLTVQRLTDDGRLAGNLEFHLTSPLQGEHYRYTSGWTYREGIIGEPLGPNARAGYANLSWRPSVLATVSLGIGVESRDPSPSTQDSPGVIRKLSQGIVENRARVLVTVTRAALASGVTVSSMVGVERASNANFVSGLDKTFMIGQLLYRVAFF